MISLVISDDWYVYNNCGVQDSYVTDVLKISLNSLQCALFFRKNRFNLAITGLQSKFFDLQIHI